MTPDTTKTSQSTIPVPLPLGNTVFTPYSPHIHSKTTKTTNSALHDMHRPRTGPQERSTAAHTRRSNYIDRPADPGPREPTFVAVPPRLASLTARAWHAGPRAAATWTAADGGLTSSAATTAPAAAAAVPVVVMASDATAARHSLRVAGVRKSARRRCMCWGTQAMQASTTEAYAWRRYLQRAASLVVRVGPPSPAVRPGPIHGMGRALYAIRHTPSRDCQCWHGAKQREMCIAEPARARALLQRHAASGPDPARIMGTAARHRLRTWAHLVVGSAARQALLEGGLRRGAEDPPWCRRRRASSSRIDADDAVRQGLEHICEQQLGNR